MGGARTMRPAAGAACVAAALGLGACGGEADRQDADEPSGAFRVEVVDASFPVRQSIADRSVMRVRVRNADTKTIPDVALTVATKPRRPGGAHSAFGQTVKDARLADGERPVWIVDRAPAGGETAYPRTWALGRLAPGRSRTFEWVVTAVEPGHYTVGYEASPGLDGRARLASGSRATGSFRVRIDDAPVAARVGDDGEVLREPGAVAP